MGIPDAVETSIRRLAARSLRPHVEPDALDVRIDDTFEHDGYSGNELIAVLVTADEGGEPVRYIAKHWDSAQWVAQLEGVERPIESLLQRGGYFTELEDLPGLHVPILDSPQADGESWVVLEDVAEELAVWKELTTNADALIGEYALLDVVARLHVTFEKESHRDRLRAAEGFLVPLERYLRRFEGLYREWYTDQKSDPRESEALQAAKRLVSTYREVWDTFLDKLPLSDRDHWMKQMLNRNALVAAADGLPVTLLHGDLAPRNVGIRREPAGDTIVLIDWEVAGIGLPTLDVVMFHIPFRDVTGKAMELLDYYFGRYATCGGRMTAAQRKRASDIATVYYGVSWLPFCGEVYRTETEGDPRGLVDAAIENTVRAVGDLGL